MKKTFNYYVITWLVAVIFFNIVIFIIPNEIFGTKIFDGAFWTGYVFIILAFAGHFICSYKVFKEENIKKIFYNIPLINISYTGLIATTVSGIICMIIPGLPEWVGAIVCLTIFALTVNAIMRANMVSEIISKIEDKNE